LALDGSEESVVKDSNKVPNWLEDMFMYCKLDRVGHTRVGTGLDWFNALAMIGSEESVVEDSYHVLNWLEDMSILAGSERLELVETG
jgi:hypothetical protein